MATTPEHRVIPAGVPFTQIANDVILDSEVNNSAFRVYAFLMKLANTDGRAWPGHRYIADHLPLSRPTVQKAVAILERTGWLTVDRSAQAHVYAVHGTQNRLPLDFENRPTNLAGQETSPAKKPDRTGKGIWPEPAKKVGLTNTQDKHPETNTQRGAGRKRDPLWDVLVEIHGEPASKSERGWFNSVRKKLADAGVTADEYPVLVAAYAAKHGNLQPSVSTIAERIGQLRKFAQAGPVVGRSLDDIRRQQELAALEAEFGTGDQEAIS